jgi:hypothetical protein
MDRLYVGIDFHGRRWVIVRLSAAGEKLSSVRVANDPVALAAAVAGAGPDPEVVVEASYGWYWVVDLLEANGARVHLANPQGLNGGSGGSRTTNATPSTWLTLRLGRLPEAWIARRRPGSCGSWCATGPSSSLCVRGSRPQCTR